MSILLSPLFQFISKSVDLSNQDQIELTKVLSIKEFQKGNLLLKEQQICTQFYFVLSGIYRVYQIVDGKEITSYFNTTERNPFVADFVSLLTSKPSKLRIECITEGQLIAIAYKDWQVIYTKSHELTTFGRLMAEFNYVLAMERIEALQYHNATQRYQSFLKTYPMLFNQIPHHYIASYLGVTPESLSRIRKNLG